MEGASFFSTPDLAMDSRVKYAQYAHASFGYLLDADEGAACLLDPLCSKCPIVGASDGFVEMTGFALEFLLGKELSMLCDGVPQEAISKSEQENISSFCGLCRSVGLWQISETTAVLANARSDGSVFMTFLMLGLVVHQEHPFIIVVQEHLCDGLQIDINYGLVNDMRASCWEVMCRIRIRVSGQTEPVPAMITLKDGSFGIFNERLEGRCILTNQGLSVQRREAKAVPTGCLVVSDVPVQRRQNDGSLYFAVRADEVVASFVGMPILGFTRRRPGEDPDMCRTLARYMGKSVLVGACGEAFARDQESNHVPSYRAPSPEEVATWCLQMDTPAHRRTPPVTINVGDKLACQYTASGSIRFLQNEEIVIEFNTGRPILPDEDYYAVIDVSFSVSGVTLLPGAFPASEEVPLIPPTSQGPMYSNDKSTAADWRDHASTCDTLLDLNGCHEADEWDAMRQDTDGSEDSLFAVPLFLERQ
jgi:hypothetical protein